MSEDNKAFIDTDKDNVKRFCRESHGILMKNKMSYTEQTFKR